MGIVYAVGIGIAIVNPVIQYHTGWWIVIGIAVSNRPQYIIHQIIGGTAIERNLKLPTRIGERGYSGIGCKVKRIIGIRSTIALYRQNRIFPIIQWNQLGVIENGIAIVNLYHRSIFDKADGCLTQIGKGRFLVNQTIDLDKARSF